MRSRLIYILLFLFIFIALLFSPLTSYLFKDFIISKLEKALDMNIVLGKTQLKFPSKLIISDIKAVDKSGPAFVAGNADFQLDVSKIIKRRIALNCNFQNVGLKSGLCNSINNILKPLGVPPQDTYIFNDMKGKIVMGNGVFAIDDLNAKGPDFKFTGNFSRTNHKEVNYDIEFNINKRIVSVSEEQKAPFLTDENFLIDEDGDGWYTVKLLMKRKPHQPPYIFFSTGGVKLQVKPYEQ